MQQLEIRYFWPLTEQIPLELDYTTCDTRPKITCGISSSGSLLMSNGTTSSWVAPSNIAVADVNTRGLTINSGTITINGMKMPWYRKLMFGLMGFKYE